MAHVREVKRATGVAYECRWIANGRDKQRTFTVRRDADRFALKVENEIAEGNSTEPLVKNSKTFREVAEASIAASAKNLKASTASGYDTGYRVHIYPVFGARRISTITSLEVEQWLAGMQAKVSDRTGRPLTSATVRGTMIALSKVFGYALKHRLIAVNPCDAVDMPKKASAAPMFLEAWQVEKLATELDRFAPYGLMVRFAAYSGLRAGELAALRIRDVNFKTGKVEVRRTVQRAKGGGWQFGTPKTTRSNRDVPLDPEILADLRAFIGAHPHRENQDAGLWPGRVQGGHGESKSALDFDRQFDIGSLYKHYFLPASNKVGLTGLKWHSLRHTYASLMADTPGIDIYDVSRWMGHSNISITDGVYMHLFKRDHSASMRKFRESINASRDMPRIGLATGKIAAG